MATPPHHHRQPHSCCCCFNCSSHYQPVSHSQPCYSHSSQPTPSDQLLQSIATHLSQLSSLSSSSLKSTQQNHDHHQQTQTLLLQSLHHRISSLESSLQTLSSSSSPPPKPTTPFSLKDLAARTIQIHFRSFLVRRSQTLRHLKDLASIRSQLNNLKAPLSDKTQLAILFQKTEPYSQKAMELLYKLDSIQNGDAMIREGKRSVRRELVGFLKFLDSFNSNNRSSKRRVFNHESSLEDLTLDGKDCEEDKEAILEKLSRNGVFEQKYGLDAKIVESNNGNLGLFAPLPLKMEDHASSDFRERKMRGGLRASP